VASIGTLNEGPIHAALKAGYAEPGDVLEASVDGYVVDILRGDLIVEIQTAGFSAIARKLRDLVARHRLRLVHPVAGERWLVKLPANGRGAPTRRRSPKRGGVEQVFEELVSLPDLLAHPNFELEVVTIEMEEVRRPRRRVGRGRARRRRDWTVVEQRLLGVSERRLVRDTADLLDLLPPDLPDPFGTTELASALGKPRWLAQKAAYCLRESGAVYQVGKKGNALVYSRRYP
jgi:hypothetical protein